MFDLKPPAPAASPPKPTPAPAVTTTPIPPKSWLRRHRRMLIIAVGLVLLAGGGALAWIFTHQPAPKPVAAKPKPTPTATPTPAPTPITKLSPLTGLPVAPELASRPVVAIMVENYYPDARPQSGLQDAGVVYEALAEGGITRFEAFFLDGQPGAIGPVRSLRPYYVDWGLEYNAPVAHAGGSADALSLAVTTGMKDLNALAIGAPTFYRSKDRYAPHNLYTSSALMDTLLGKRGFNQPAAFEPSPRKADAPSTTPPHPNIRINFSSAAYLADYKYDPASNDYARSLAGVPHVDRNTGKQIHVKNVVVEYTSVIASGDDHNHVNITTTGTGKCVLLRDGDAVPCTWSKASRSARTQLLDATGAPLPLNAGNTWYEIVPTTKTATY